MLELIRNGLAYSLDDGTYCWLIGDDGWGMTPLHRLTTRGPQQHGETDEGYLLDPRVGKLILQILGTSRNDLYQKRNTLLNLFSPQVGGGLALRWTTYDTRQIDVQTVGDMLFGSGEREGFAQKVGIQLRAPDPSFYDPEAVTVDFGTSGGGSGFVVPMPVPHSVGASSLSETLPVSYTGTWLAYPFIRITGPITNPVITNETTNEKLDFTGTTITAGTYYDIDTRYGYKTVIDSGGTNRIDKLTADSDLVSFHIEHDTVVAPGGYNSISVTGSAITTATKITLTYFRRFVGL